VCSGLRLARFNTVSSNAEDEPTLAALQKKYFIGVPMPAAGLLVLIPVMIQIDTGYNISSLLYAGFASGIGMLMVSKIPTFAFKSINVQPSQIILLLGLIGILVIGMMTRPWFTLPIVGLLYVTSFILSYRSYRKELMII
jgi:CDP-diacylglycerol--serine O-phosphatidyltransferase